MAITKSMMNFVSPIITKNLETGGRSSMTQVTDYSGMTDALTKKAQMEYNMATFKADMEMRMADSKAANQLQIIDIEDRRIDKELADRAASQDMGDMEKIMGVMQGAASGAQAGMATGNPWVAAGAAVAGGAAVAHDAYGGKPGDEKRASVQNTNKTLGAVATIATATRGMYDDFKGKKAFEKGSKRLSEMRAGIESMPSGAAKDQAIQEYNQVKASVSGEIGGYLGIEAGNSAAEGFTKGESGIFSKDPEEKYQAQVASLGSSLAAAIQSANGDPVKIAQARESHYAQLQTASRARNGYESGKGDVSPEDFMAFEGGAVGSGQAGAGGSYGGQGGATGGVGGGAGGVPNMADGDSIQQDPSFSQSTVSVPGFAGGTFTFPTGGGGGGAVSMDDGGPVAAAEQNLTKMGGPAAEAFRETQGRGEQQSEESVDLRGKSEDEQRQALFEMIKKDNPKLTDRQVEIIVEDELRGDHDGDGSVDGRDGAIAGGRSNANVAPPEGYDEAIQAEANDQGTVKEKSAYDKFRGFRDKTLDKVTSAVISGDDTVYAMPGSGKVQDKIRDGLQLDVPREGGKGGKPLVGGKGGNVATKLNAPTGVPQAEKAEIKKLSGEFQKVDQELNRKLEGARQAGFANQGGDVTAKNIKNANEGYNATVPLIGRLPHGSQVKAVAAELYMNGSKGSGGGASMLTMPIGKLLGGTGGLAIGSVSNMLGMNKSEVAKLQGSRKTLGEILTKDEMDALDEYKSIKAAQIAPIVKTDDSGAIQNAEEVRAYSQQINFGQSLAAQYRTVLQGKKNLMTKAGSEEWSSTGARKGIEMTQRTGAEATGRVQTGKAQEEAFLREQGRQMGKPQPKYRPGFFTIGR